MISSTKPNTALLWYCGVFISEDIAFRSSTITSPKILKKYFIPKLKRIVEIYHSEGLKVIFYSDDNLWDVIDALNPIGSCTSMDIEKLRKRCPES